MNTVKINLSLKILPADQTVYMIRPGSNYHLYDKFAQLEAVAPDFPFLELEHGEMPAQKNNIDQQLARGVAFRAWQKKSKAKREAAPSRRLDGYTIDDQVSTHSKTRLLNVAQRILWDLPAGAVIFIPASTLYGNAIIGELCPAKDDRIEFHGDGLRKSITYLGRKLANVEHHPMRNFPPEVTDVAKSPTVIQSYDGYAKDRVLRSYYGDYQLGHNVAMMEFEAQNDKFDPITMARITALAVAIEFYERHGVHKHPGELLFAPSVAGTLEVHASINSPNGKLLLEGSKKIPHTLRALLLAASLVVSGTATADEVGKMLYAGQVTVVNDKEVVRSEFVEATERSLMNFARAAGEASMEDYIKALAESSQRSGADVDGDAEIE